MDVELTEDSVPIIPKVSTLLNKYSLSEEELEAIMLREFGPIRRKRYTEPKIITADKPNKAAKKKEKNQSWPIAENAATGSRILHSSAMFVVSQLNRKC